MKQIFAILSIILLCATVISSSGLAIDYYDSYQRSENFNMSNAEPWLEDVVIQKPAFPKFYDFNWPLNIEEHREKYTNESWIPPLVDSFYVTQGSHPGHVGSVDVSTGVCGSRIVASKSGIVERIGDTGNSKGRGVYVRIRHHDGLKTLYSHLVRDKVLVGKGEFVEQGQSLGFIGMTGRSTGCHLHFEVWYSNYNFLNNY